MDLDLSDPNHPLNIRRRQADQARAKKLQDKYRWDKVLARTVISCFKQYKVNAIIELNLNG